MEDAHMDEQFDDPLTQARYNLIFYLDRDNSIEGADYWIKVTRALFQIQMERRKNKKESVPVFNMHTKELYAFYDYNWPDNSWSDPE